MIEGISADYLCPADAYDEMRRADGQPRALWRTLLESADLASAEALETRWREAGRLIRENGVTYNVYGDPRGLARPWPLDPLPLIIGAEEWRLIEAGLAQRARLFEAMIGDLYGPQDLLRSGAVPPGAVFGNPGFLRPCHGIAPPDGVRLHLSAVDLGRTLDGQWVVVGDRTQTPSGAGYALENRTVVSRSLPDAFGAQPVRQLGDFFAGLKESLFQAAAAAARRSRGSAQEPRIVLLTPGPYNEVYFEHAYLARNLGYSLVAGEDLTVRYDRVYLKTLSGLQPVDGILRRLDDDYCDPLWLKSSSSLGIPGLLGAARRGHVAICNQLGSGVVEAAALQPYLPEVARRLLGEELLLPQAEARWLGAPGAMAALDSLADTVIKPAFTGGNMAPIFADRLDREGREALKNKIARRPAAYVAQRRLRVSAAPCWLDGKLVARPVLLRSFVAASPTGPIVLPGGLTRMAARAGEAIVSMQWGGGSKDTWVVAEAPVASGNPPAIHSESIELRRTQIDLPSRVADNLFWLGRYAERAEFALRLARAALNRGAPDFSGGGAAMPRLLILLEEFAVAPPAKPGSAALLEVLEPALREHLEVLHRTATVVRDRLSLDTWRALSPMTPPPAQGRTSAGAIARLDQLLARLASFNGLAMENMTRGLGWRFLQIGRRLERAQQTLGAVSVLGDATQAEEAPALDALLEICDSGMTYRSRYFTGLSAAPVFDLVLADEANPRAVAFQMTAMVEHIRQLPRERAGHMPTPEHRLAAAGLAGTRRLDVQRLALTPPAGKPARPALDEFCAALAADLAALSDALNEAYFKHAMAAPIAPGGGAVDQAQGMN